MMAFVQLSSRVTASVVVFNLFITVQSVNVLHVQSYTCTYMCYASDCIVMCISGDIITANGGSVMARQHEQPEYSDIQSVCSCSCYNLRSKRASSRAQQQRYSVTRSPGRIKHLLPFRNKMASSRDANSCGNDDDGLSMDDDSASPCHDKSKRASI